jgi:hypothetical protein
MQHPAEKPPSKLAKTFCKDKRGLFGRIRALFVHADSAGCGAGAAVQTGFAPVGSA